MQTSSVHILIRNPAHTDPCCCASDSVVLIVTLYGTTHITCTVNKARVSLTAVKYNMYGVTEVW